VIFIYKNHFVICLKLTTKPDTIVAENQRRAQKAKSKKQKAKSPLIAERALLELQAKKNLL